VKGRGHADTPSQILDKILEERGEHIILLPSRFGERKVVVVYKRRCGKGEYLYVPSTHWLDIWVAPHDF
jgi:hypothetical protein